MEPSDLPRFSPVGIGSVLNRVSRKTFGYRRRVVSVTVPLFPGPTVVRSVSVTFPVTYLEPGGKDLGSQGDG